MALPELKLLLHPFSSALHQWSSVSTRSSGLREKVSQLNQVVGQDNIPFLKQSFFGVHTSVSQATRFNVLDKVEWGPYYPLENLAGCNF